MNYSELKAFPGLGQDGLTMRDYFAANAMAQFLRDQMSAPSDLHTNWLDSVAIDAYSMADSMMRARGQS